MRFGISESGILQHPKASGAANRSDILRYTG